MVGVGLELLNSVPFTFMNRLNETESAVSKFCRSLCFSVKNFQVAFGLVRSVVLYSVSVSYRKCVNRLFI